MYFAVIGNHPHIALKELALAGVFSWEKRAEHLFVFSCSAPERLAELASLIKWGKVLPVEEVENFLAGKRLLGTADSSL